MSSGETGGVSNLDARAAEPSSFPRITTKHTGILSYVGPSSRTDGLGKSAVLAALTFAT